MKIVSFVLLPYAGAYFSPSPTRRTLRNRHSFPTIRHAGFKNVGLAAFPSFQDFVGPALSTLQKTNAEQFLKAWNEKRIDDALALVDSNVEFIDTEFASPFQGKHELERILRLSSASSSECYAVDDIAFDSRANKVGILFHMERAGDGAPNGRIGTAIFELDQESDLIKAAFMSKESSKSGESNLKILKAASEVLALLPKKNEGAANPPEMKARTDPSLPEQYFQAWNERDIDKACDVFDENVEYDDTAFPAPFVGKQKLKAHLQTCAACFPPTMSFVVDDVVTGSENLMVRWHAENNGDVLPFTRGCSFYNVKGERILKGVDVVEPAVFKTGSLSLVSKQIRAEPIRLVPLAVWAVYMYVVFFSDWFFGLPATALEQRTWEEVKDLSLNFFLVAPLLHLPFAPVVHPMLEGVFNLLLSWAAMFAGFLSDGRRDKPNVLPMLPIVAGMQFLTSAFLLPFLATRSNESNDNVSLEDLSEVSRLTERPALGIAMGGVGTGAIIWGLLARDNFGGWAERFPSFLQLLSIDRVGSSCLVDLAIFALFQGWLVDDDLKRRSMSSGTLLANVAKFVPFFGLAAYLTFRTPILPREDKA
eukprot:scaffold14497_cov119-Cylindrotheca_fusiformis.AAC.9